MSLSDFVKSLPERAEAAAASSSRGLTTLVCGNEAADADSIVTAIVFAYLLHQDSNAGVGAVFPVVQCLREDIQLRSETVLLLRRCGVEDVSKLLFLADAVVQKLLQLEPKLVLTDHNATTGQLFDLEAQVTEIIDHHEDLGRHQQVQSDKRLIAFEQGAATVASACTLVAERYLTHPQGEELLHGDSSAVARALLGVILIDSVNLDPAAKKVTPRDVAIASKLAAIAPMPSQEELFQLLNDAKFDADCWEGLSLAQCLRYDFKSFEAAGKTVGLASVLCPLASISAKTGWPGVAAGEAKRYSLYGILANARQADGSFQRQMALLGEDSAFVSNAVRFLKTYKDGLLDLEALDLPGADGANVQVFAQKNLAASRKQVAPACLDFFAAVAKGS